MKVGEKYSFKVNRIVEDKNISVVLDKNDDEHIIKGIYKIGDRVELVVSNVKRDKYYLSFPYTKNKSLYLNNLYEMDIVEVVDRRLIKIRHDGEIFKAKTLNDNELKAGEKALLRIVSIFPEELSVVVNLDLDKLYNVNEKYEFPIVSIEHQNIDFSIVKFKIPQNLTMKIYVPSWIQLTDGLSDKITVIYEGEGRWFCDYQLLECPLFEKGKEYPVLLTGKMGNGYVKGLVNDNIQVQVLAPFSDNKYLDKNILYMYEGIDKKGYLGFRQKVKFEDVVNSRALKVIAFDNLRKEYKDDLLQYDKLFSDYENNNNLWVLTYGNTLMEVIEDKIRVKEWDIAYVLLEVLEKIETWILNSGYLNAFSFKKRQGIENDAPHKIKYAKLMMFVIWVLLEGNFEEINKKLNESFSKPEYSDQLPKYLRALSEILKIEEGKIPKKLFPTLEMIKLNWKSIEAKKLDKEIYHLRKSIISSIISIEKKLFQQVFINPLNRNKFYGQRNELEELILLTAWLIQTSSSHSEIYNNKLRLLRFIAYYETDYQKQEQIILNALQLIFSNSQKVNIDFSSLVIEKGKIEEITKIILNKKRIPQKEEPYFFPEKIPNVSIKFFNPFGGIIETEEGRIVIPNREQNQWLKSGEKIDCEILAFDPINHLAYGTSLRNQVNTNIANLDSQKIEVGCEVIGVIKSIVTFGMFISFGEKEGLLHATRITYQTTDLLELFNEGDEIKVKIISNEDERLELDRLALLKETAKKNPYKRGQKVKGKVIRRDPFYGFYLELQNGASGFIPINDFCFNQEPSNLDYYYFVGEVVEAKVMALHQKGYTLSVTHLFNRDKAIKSLQNGKLHRVRIIEFFDIESQIQNRIKREINWDSFSKPFCPACQRAQYDKRTGILSNLEISQDEKSWSCLWCDYRSKEQVIIRFLDVPLTAFSFTSNIKIKFLDTDILGKEVNVEVLAIKENKYIEVVIPNEKELITIEKNPVLSKRIAVELGFFYEILAGISEDHKDELLNMSRYCFGLAKMSRSYFHSMLGQYINFIHSIETAPIKTIEWITAKAKNLYELNCSEEQAMETFPILQHINSNLEIISNIKINSLKAVENLFEVIQKNGDQSKLVDAAMTAISLSSVNDEFLEEEIWDSLKFNLKNNLRVIQDDELDVEAIGLRKRIKEIINNNNESDTIECKSSIEIPVPTKDSILNAKKMRAKLEMEEMDEEQKKNILDKIHRLENPKPSKEMIAIVNHSWVKTIGAFANSKGGELLIGIGEDENDNLILLGLDADLSKFKSEDKLLLAFDTLFQKFIGNEYQGLVAVKIVRVGGKSVLYIKVEKSSKNVFVRGKQTEEFYIRRNASTVKLSMREFADYNQIRM